MVWIEIEPQFSDLQRVVSLAFSSQVLLVLVRWSCAAESPRAYVGQPVGQWVGVVDSTATW